MVCRNKDKAEEARADIVKESGNKVWWKSNLPNKTGIRAWLQAQYGLILTVLLQEVYVHILDLSETRKVWEFAEAFKKKYKALNVLVSGISSVNVGASSEPETEY